jgi:uncharacterized protein (TIGR00159 family)
MIELLRSMILSFTFYDFIDIAIITMVAYKLLTLMKGTRAVYMAVSVAGITIMLLISHRLGLRTTSWILSNVTGYLFIMFVILFQPELRRALTALGEAHIFAKISKGTTNKILDEIVRAATMLANRQIGALIVLQRKMDLVPIVTIGQHLDSEVTRELLMSIFIPYSPLHDGAVLISGGRLSYAACILPLTKREDINQAYGTRHRAAIGITEETDAVVVVVSEERGAMAMVVNGIISTELDAQALEESLASLFNLEENK